MVCGHRIARVPSLPHEFVGGAKTSGTKSEDCYQDDMNFFRSLSLAAVLALVVSRSGAALIVNPPMTIDRQLTVHVIQVADDAGGNAAPLFGSASAQTAIFAGIDTIWAQAGIDVEFKFRLSPYNDTFTLTGTPGNNN